MNAVIKEPENQIVEFDEFQLKLAEFKEKYDDVVYDLTVPEQEKQARADKHSIGKVLSKLDSAHKALKAPLKEKVDLIDGRRKEIKDQLLDVQGKIKDQIASHDKAIEEHAEMLQLRIDTITSYAEHESTDGKGSEYLKDELRALKSVEVDDSYEDRKADATLAKVETIGKLETMLATAVGQEAKDAELERLRREKEARERADREEEIRKDAEAKATRQAEEKAEREKQEAAKKAQKEIDDAKQKQQEAEDAEAKAKTEAKDKAGKAAKEEREKIEREQAEKERQERIERDRAEAKKRKSAHRENIEKQAIESLVAAIYELDDAHAKPIIEAIKEGLIKHVSIYY